VQAASVASKQDTTTRVELATKKTKNETLLHPRLTSEKERVKEGRK
jgi:hypothetical protein